MVLKTYYHSVLFLLFLVCQSYYGIAQSTELYPYQISQTFNQSSLLNSAIASDTNYFGVDFTNRTLIGVFNGVSQNYLNVYLSSTGNSENTRHSFGAMAVNKNEGDYIKRNRLYLRYGVQVAISRKSRVSLGSSLGFINYLFQSSVANGGGSAFARDLNIGAVYAYPNFNLGVSVNQLFYPELSPLNERIRLTRYYNANSYYRLTIDQVVALELYALASFYEAGLLTMKSSLIAVLRRQFLVGGGYNYNQGIDAYIGLRKLEIASSNFDFMVSFLAYNTRKLSTTTDRSIEFSIRYFIE